MAYYQKCGNTYYMNLQSAFIQHLTERFPDLQNQDLKNLISENLLSPHSVPFNRDLLAQAQDFVSATFKLRNQPDYISYFSDMISGLGLSPSRNNSILMSYDFHLAADGNLKLVEINTNASFLALAWEMYQIHRKPWPIPNFTIEQIRTDIQNEIRLNGGIDKALQSISIVDENPAGQRLFIEFLLYQQLFKSWGFDARIEDVSQVSQVDFIYNRWTDFYLQEEKSQALKALYNGHSTCVSPQPIEYLLLADKERMVLWNDDAFLSKMGLDSADIQKIRRNLPHAEILSPKNSENIWAKRKSFFFKPLRSFGAKQSYRGASISRTAFDSISKDEFFAQEFVPPAELTFKNDDIEQRYKYDLRVYAYQSRIEGIVARLYQGQVTNLRTPGGGFACVELI